MLTFPSNPTRRNFLAAGTLAVGGLTLADVLRARAAQDTRPTRGKSVIMVYLNGGPSHIDMYDPKPEAPEEYRGEFKPIQTNVTGVQISEMLPLHAKIADKFAIVRNMKFQQEGHTGPELYTGFLRGNRPSIGSIVSRLRTDAGVRSPLPPYVYIGDANHVGGPGFLGKAHEAYIPGERGAAQLGRLKSVSLEQLAERRTLLKTFDDARKELDDPRGSRAGMDAFTAHALEMMTTDAARDAFDVSKEPLVVREKYGRGTEYLMARRLVEAGVPVVSITPQNHNVPKDCNGQWDHHDHVFRCLRAILPGYDKSVHALITDLHDRGLQDDVGATNARGERPLGEPYTPQNVLATLYRVLEIDPQTTLNDHSGRPVYLLDDPKPIKELV
jgi:hypothetical protein